jgi:hypothetical protein
LGSIQTFSGGIFATRGRGSGEGIMREDLSMEDVFMGEETFL